MESPIIINRPTPFHILGLLSGIFHSNCNKTLCKQTLETWIRRCILLCRLWVCTVFICPIKRTLCLYGLKKSLSSAVFRLTVIMNVDGGARKQEELSTLMHIKGRLLKRVVSLTNFVPFQTGDFL